MSVRALAVANAIVLLGGVLAVGADPGVGSADEVVAVAAPQPSSEPSSRPSPAVWQSPPPVAQPGVAPPPAVVPVPPPPPVAPSPRADVRATTTTGYQPYATAGPVVLHAPGDVVEVVGFHQSSHDGAQPQSPVQSGVRAGLLDQRSRDTDPAGAADIVVDPAREVRSPVTGTVVRAGTYTLYCDHVDEYLVVEPDARPGWEVKVLHVVGLQVGVGDRLEAGATVVARTARVLPFRSQVDDHTVAPAWPHVHVEVVDPSVPDRPTGGGC